MDVSKIDRKKIMLFRFLRNGSRFVIHAEPTRGVKHYDVTDETVYVKHSDAYSTSTVEPKKDIILHPNDLIRRV